MPLSGLDQVHSACGEEIVLFRPGWVQKGEMPKVPDYLPRQRGDPQTMNNNNICILIIPEP